MTTGQKSRQVIEIRPAVVANLPAVRRLVSTDLRFCIYLLQA